MFYSIPVSNQQVVTHTPLSAKAITHVFFESKNDGVFLYKEVADNVTITIDGKMICRNVPILPFMTTTSYGRNRHKWQDVALEVNLNVDLSEIKISGQNNNDFNVVFVCSDKPVETTGFDFVESFRVKIKQPFSGTQRETLINRLWEDAQAAAENGETIKLSDYASEYTWLTNQNYEYSSEMRLYSTHRSIYGSESAARGANQYSLIANTVSGSLIQKSITLIGTESLPPYSVQQTVGIPPNIGLSVEVEDYVDMHNGRWMVVFQLYRMATEEEWKKTLETNLNYLYAQLTAGEWGVEKTISLDREPLKMFAMQMRSDTSLLTNPKVLSTSPINKLNFTLSGGASQEFPANTDLELIQAKDFVAWRNIVHTFGQPIPRTLQLTYDYNHNGNITLHPFGNPQLNYGAIIPNTWDLYFFFIYKKII